MKHKIMFCGLLRNNSLRVFLTYCVYDFKCALFKNNIYSTIRLTVGAPDLSASNDKLLRQRELSTSVAALIKAMF